jgi:xanthine dehydrogenase YagS FAD-binding subunit
MNEFRYECATDSASAATLFAGAGHARYLGGGTNLVDLMRETIERPDLLVDVSGLDTQIRLREDGALWIGAAATNTAVAAHRLVRERYPVLARAILSGASGQIRNMATVGGNLLQRTRCLYFFNAAARCNKRQRGAGCDAVGGFNRMHAILGASPSCVATHPSDMCVALAALGAQVHVQGASGTRSIAMVDLHRLPGDTPDVETDLSPGELITAIELPPLAFAVNSTYRKVRDRASYAFALISVAGLGVLAATAWAATRVLQRVPVAGPDRLRPVAVTAMTVAMACATIAVLVWGLRVRTADAAAFDGDQGLVATPFLSSWIAILLPLCAATVLSGIAARRLTAA